MYRISSWLLVLLIGSCAIPKPNQNQTFMEQDPHSYAIPNQARVSHLSWKAVVDFDSKTIDATATWTIEADQADSIRLDTKGLMIKSVSVDNKEQAAYRLGDTHAILGEELVIPLEENTRTIRIDYTTSPGAEALQWLTPQQTAGKNAPFLFTQSQAILARSWIPCQDTPGVRFTYDAEVTVPAGLLALMSASNPREKNPTGAYHFEMKQPVPSYLLALAVGDITFEPISDRSGVYAEAQVVQQAAWEFADLEKMIQAAEGLYGPYQWERYDVLVLPPSFPFGGMENPRLTFATPTILAGDRSLTSLIAHELAHSWSGNLVTNATWNDFWLNEGFTVYFETRIMEELYGKDYGEMLAALNLHELHEEIASLREKGLSADTRLKLELDSRNPDDGVTSIAYNKGYFFLRSIEEAHGRDKFDAFLNDYFRDHAFGTMTTEKFRNYIVNYYRTKFHIGLEPATLDEWIFAESLPDRVPEPNSDRFQKVDRLLTTWKSTKTADTLQSSSWTSHEWLHFLHNLPEQLSLAEMEQLDEFGDFSATGNSEVLTAWGVIAIRNQYTKMYPAIEHFLINTGRRKFLMPLYTEMLRTEKGRQWARDVYAKARPNYHFVATNSLDNLISP